MFSYVNPENRQQKLTDTDWMQVALQQAQLAYQAGEVPVGAVLVKDGHCIAVGRNAPIEKCDPCAHAETMALRRGGYFLKNYRLVGCELFVTLEPCMMCTGAMLHARLNRVVFGAFDAKTGAAGSKLNLFSDASLNHQTTVEGGVLQTECRTLLQKFFKEKRMQKRV